MSTIKKYKMFKRGEKIGVALSGGKDSMSALFVLKKIEGKFNLGIIAISIDEGIKGYRRKTIKAAKIFCKDNEVPIEVVSFKKSLGKTLDEMKGANACTYCGVFRRRLLNKKALELGVNKIVTGHNLDDEAQAILMNYVRGDIERLIRLQSPMKQAKFINKVKPLMEISEKEVALYAILQEFGASFVECPYSSESFRTGIRDMLNLLEKNNAGIKFSILRGYQRLLPYLEKYSRKNLKECAVCGEQSSQKICRACELLKVLGLLQY